MIESREPIIVEFPLRGEWLSPNTPGTKIPSHGTNQLMLMTLYKWIGKERAGLAIALVCRNIFFLGLP